MVQVGGREGKLMKTRNTSMLASRFPLWGQGEKIVEYVPQIMNTFTSTLVQITTLTYFTKLPGASSNLIINIKRMIETTVILHSGHSLAK